MWLERTADAPAIICYKRISCWVVSVPLSDYVILDVRRARRHIVSAVAVFALYMSFVCWLTDHLQLGYLAQISIVLSMSFAMFLLLTIVANRMDIYGRKSKVPGYNDIIEKAKNAVTSGPEP